MSDQNSWCWSSTPGSIARGVRSVTAIPETIIAVVLHRWTALHLALSRHADQQRSDRTLIHLRSDGSANPVQNSLPIENTVSSESCPMRHVFLRFG
jgi:hypothetical protein